jgi:hypothetical protein
MPLSNPYTNDDWFSELVKQDVNVEKEKRKRLQAFLAKNKSQSNIFMSIKRGYFKFLYILTHNVIAAIVIFLAASSIVTASAAQVLAPQSIKPSTIIENLFLNKQKQTQENSIKTYTVLTPDESNDVFVNTFCGIAVKYPKIIESQKIAPIMYINGPGSSAQTFDSEKSIYLSTLDKGEGKFGSAFIACSDGDKIFNTNTDNAVSIDKEKLKSITGWSITDEVDLQNIRIQDRSDDANSEYSISFLFENRHYEFRFDRDNSENNKSIKGIFADQIKVQFESLVKSQTNAEIQLVDLEKYLSSNESQSTNSSNLLMNTFSNKYYPNFSFEYPKNSKLVLKQNDSEENTDYQKQTSLIIENLEINLGTQPASGVGFLCYNGFVELPNGLARVTDYREQAENLSSETYYYGYVKTHSGLVKKSDPRFDQIIEAYKSDKNIELADSLGKCDVIEDTFNPDKNITNRSITTYASLKNFVTNNVEISINYSEQINSGKNINDSPTLKQADAIVGSMKF